MVEIAVKAFDFFGSKLHSTDGDRIKDIIGTFSDVFAGVPFGAALADQD